MPKCGIATPQISGWGPQASPLPLAPTATFAPDRTPKPARETIRHDARLDERSNAARHDQKTAETAWNRTVNFSKQNLM